MTLQQGADYARKLKNVSADYYYYAAGKVYWKRSGTQQTQTDVILVEVWAGSNAHSHPSRNPFHWIDDQRQKEVWHALTTGPTSPKWAEVDSLIGYTSARPILFNGATGAPSPHKLLEFASQVIHAAISDSDMAAAKGTERSEWLPSVYYKSGHRTLDHSQASNITWKDLSRHRYLFFGNVPENDANRLHP